MFMVSRVYLCLTFPCRIVRSRRDTRSKRWTHTYVYIILVLSKSAQAVVRIMIRFNGLRVGRRGMSRPKYVHLGVSGRLSELQLSIARWAKYWQQNISKVRVGSCRLPRRPSRVVLDFSSLPSLFVPSSFPCLSPCLLLQRQIHQGIKWRTRPLPLPPPPPTRLP